MTTDARGPVCRDCIEDFDADTSPDVERCQRCAEDHQWREGAALVTPGLGDGLSADPVHPINHAPTRRVAQEA